MAKKQRLREYALEVTQHAYDNNRFLMEQVCMYELRKYLIRHGFTPTEKPTIRWVQKQHDNGIFHPNHTTMICIASQPTTDQLEETLNNGSTP